MKQTAMTVTTVGSIQATWTRKIPQPTRSRYEFTPRMSAAAVKPAAPRSSGRNRSSSQTCRSSSRVAFGRTASAVIRIPASSCATYIAAASRGRRLLHLARAN